MKKLHTPLLVVIPCLLCLLAFPYRGGPKPCGNPSSVNVIESDTELLFFPSVAVPGARPGSWKVGIHAWAYEPANRTPNCTVRTGISAPARLRAYACGMSLKNPVTMRARAQGFQGSFGRSLAPV